MEPPVPQSSAPQPAPQSVYPQNSPTPALPMQPATMTNVSSDSITPQNKVKPTRINRLTFILTYILFSVVIPLISLGIWFGTLFLVTPSNQPVPLPFVVILFVTLFVFVFYYLWAFLRAFLYRIRDVGISDITILLIFIPVVSLLFTLFLFIKGGVPETTKFGEVPQGVTLKRIWPIFGNRS